MNKFQILSTKTNIQLKKLELFWIKKNKIRNLFSILVIIFVSLFVVATKYERSVNAAGLSNMVIAQGMDYAKCEEQSASKAWSKWIAQSGPTFDTKEFDNLTSIGDIAINWLTIPCKDTIVVPENEIDDFLEAYYPTFYIPNYASYDRTSSGDFVITDINGSSTVGLMGNTMASLYQNKSVSTEYFANQTLAKINPVKYTDAAATLPKYVTMTGAEILTATSKATSITISIAISIIIIIIIIDAIAILLRKKINPGTLVSLLNGIPSLIISILLIVFSYPLSSIIVDTGNMLTNTLQSFVFNQVRINIPNNIPNAANPGTIVYYTDINGNLQDVVLPSSLDGMTIAEIYKQDLVDEFSPLDVFFYSISARKLNVFNVFGTANVGQSIEQTFLSTNGGITVSPIQVGGTTLVSSIVDILNNMIPKSEDKKDKDNTAVSFSQSTPGGLIAFILAVVAFMTLFKIFFALLKSFVLLLFLPVAAPIYFILSAVPGQSKLIGKWFRSILAAVLTFVAFYGASILIVYLGTGFLAGGTSANVIGWFPPGIGVSGRASLNLMYSLAAYGIFLMLPNLPKMIDSMLGVTGSGFDKYGSSAVNQTRSVLRKIPLVNMVPGI